MNINELLISKDNINQNIWLCTPSLLGKSKGKENAEIQRAI